MANIVVQEMSFEEKYENVNDAIDLFRDFVPSFVKRHLGPQAERELRRRWRENTEVVAIDAPTDQKYERSYANWIAMARVNFELIRDRMGEEGIEKFVEAEAVQLRRQNSGMAVSMLDMIRAFSRPTAFKMMAKKFAYQTQWITSYETTELTNQIAFSRSLLARSWNTRRRKMYAKSVANEFVHAGWPTNLRQTCASTGKVIAVLAPLGRSIIRLNNHLEQFIVNGQDSMPRCRISITQFRLLC